jgi:hypothetical protein
VRSFSWGIEAKVGSRSRDFLAAFHGAKPASAIYQRCQLHGPSVRAELAESVERWWRRRRLTAGALSWEIRMSAALDRRLRQSAYVVCQPIYRRWLTWRGRSGSMVRSIKWRRMAGYSIGWLQQPLGQMQSRRPDSREAQLRSKLTAPATATLDVQRRS